MPALRPAGLQDGAPRTRAHAVPEAVAFCPPPVVWLVRALHPRLLEVRSWPTSPSNRLRGHTANEAPRETPGAPSTRKGSGRSPARQGGQRTSRSVHGARRDITKLDVTPCSAPTGAC